MSNHNIEVLREHLFATLAALRSKDEPMDLERARAVSEVAKTIIDTARVEVAYLKLNEGGESRFIAVAKEEKLPDGITGVTRHRIQG